MRSEFMRAWRNRIDAGLSGWGSSRSPNASTTMIAGSSPAALPFAGWNPLLNRKAAGELAVQSNRLQFYENT